MTNFEGVFVETEGCAEGELSYRLTQRAVSSCIFLRPGYGKTSFKKRLKIINFN
jgi:hypothetical protein